MKKSSVIWLVLATVIVSLLVNVFFGRFLTAKISTLPILNKWKLMSPQAPIVIRENNQVRVSDTGDILAAIEAAKSRMSSILVNNGTSVTLAGNAINLTSDGYFLTTNGTLQNLKPENIIIKLANGTTGKIISVHKDIASNIVIVKTDITNVPVANLAVSKDVAPGQKIVVLGSSVVDFSPIVKVTVATVSQQNAFEVVFDADAPSRTFLAQGLDASSSGQALVNLDGEVVGVMDGVNIISSDVIKYATTNYFNNSQKIVRPTYGFTYKNNSGVEARLLGQPLGSVVKKVEALGPAAKAGLLENDLITSVEGDKISEDRPLEELLQRFKPGDVIKLEIYRNKQTINLSLTAGELK